MTHWKTQAWLILIMPCNGNGKSGGGLYWNWVAMLHQRRCATRNGDGHIVSTPNNNPPSNFSQRPVTDAEAREEMPVPDQPTHWRNAVVPIGKHKGKFLGNLHPKSRKWFLTNFEPNENYQDSIDFRNACNQCIAETGEAEPRDEFTAQSAETIDDIAEQSANDPTDPDLDEDVPF